MIAICGVCGQPYDTSLIHLCDSFRGVGELNLSGMSELSIHGVSEPDAHIVDSNDILTVLKSIDRHLESISKNLEQLHAKIVRNAR